MIEFLEKEEARDGQVFWALGNRNLFGAPWRDSNWVMGICHRR